MKTDFYYWTNDFPSIIYINNLENRLKLTVKFVEPNENERKEKTQFFVGSEHNKAKFRIAKF